MELTNVSAALEAAFHLLEGRNHSDCEAVLRLIQDRRPDLFSSEAERLISVLDYADLAEQKVRDLHSVIASVALALPVGERPLFGPPYDLSQETESAVAVFELTGDGPAILATLEGEADPSNLGSRGVLTISMAWAHLYLYDRQSVADFATWLTKVAQQLD
jgi:hypothetical protein